MEETMKLGKKGHYFTNWAATYSCQPELYFEPESLNQIKQILHVARVKGKKVKVVGMGHSPSDLACTTDYMISLRKFNQILMVDRENYIVKVQGGISVEDLNEALAANQLAISVLGSVSNITLAGAVSVGTHGTGITFGSISSYILEMELMVASGEMMRLSREQDADLLRAAACSLGALGIIISITLQCEPAFRLQQTRYKDKLQDVLEHLSVHLTSSDHFRFMWYPYMDDVIVEHSSRTATEVANKSSWFWDNLIGYHLVEFMYYISTYLPSLVPHINRQAHRLLFAQRDTRVDRSDKIFNFNCLFKQFVMEWAVPVENTAMVLLELKAWIEQNKFPAHFPIEVRFVKSCDLMLGPTHGRDSCFINIIMYRPYNKTVPHDSYWNAFQRIMKEAQGRPHWAKDYNMSPTDFTKIYPEWQKFCKIRKQLDPEGCFLNANLARLFKEDFAPSEAIDVTQVQAKL